MKNTKNSCTPPPPPTPDTPLNSILFLGGGDSVLFRANFWRWTLMMAQARSYFTCSICVFTSSTIQKGPSFSVQLRRNKDEILKVTTLVITWALIWEGRFGEARSLNTGHIKGPRCNHVLLVWRFGVDFCASTKLDFYDSAVLCPFAGAGKRTSTWWWWGG